MAKLSGFPYVEIQFDKAGGLVEPKQVDEVGRVVKDLGITDLIVWSHGWNNDMDEARDHYKLFAAQMKGAAKRHLAGSKVAILGVLWPSKKFADNELIPGGAASAQDANQEALIDQLDSLKGAFTDPKADRKLADARKLVPKLDSPRVQAQFLDLIKDAARQPSSDDDEEEGSSELLDLEADEVFSRLSGPIAAAPRLEADEGGAAGTGAAAFNIGEFAQGAFAAAQQVLNFATYFQMKERAGLVGRVGLDPVLRQLRREHPATRLHLVGHSFGARLVTAAAGAASSPRSASADSLTLLQGAFSHNGFAKNYKPGKNGFFRTVVSPGRVKGPILITHTDNDTAVGVNYAIISRLSGTEASGVGDAKDLFGGIGRNGAIHTPEAEFGTLGATGVTYDFDRGRVYNLLADDFISDHGDVHTPEVANALAQSIASTR